MDEEVAKPCIKVHAHSMAAEFAELTYLSIPYRIPHKVDGKTTIRKMKE